VGNIGKVEVTRKKSFVSGTLQIDGSALNPARIGLVYVDKLVEVELDMIAVSLQQ